MIKKLTYEEYIKESNKDKEECRNMVREHLKRPFVFTIKDFTNSRVWPDPSMFDFEECIVCVTPDGEILYSNPNKCYDYNILLMLCVFFKTEEKLERRTFELKINQLINEDINIDDENLVSDY